MAFHLVPALVAAVLVAGSQVVTDSDALSEEQRATAVRLGSSCLAPVVRIPAQGQPFELFIEGPVARVAVVTAAALLMNQPLESAAVRGAIRSGHRLWLWRPDDAAPVTPMVRSLIVRTRSGDIPPTRIRNDGLYLGSVPSHGIIPPLRHRWPEYSFSSLPAGGFEVMVQTDGGGIRYEVEENPLRQPMRVCNGGGATTPIRTMIPSNQN